MKPKHLVMNKFTIPTLVSISFFSLLFSCSNDSKHEPKELIVEEKIIEVEEEKPTLNIDELVKSIDEERASIESQLGEPMEISTSELKEKIKQKWSKIEFYTIDDKVSRIKTYPYPGISKRTEEFYLKDRALILAVIEDNGSGDRGKSKEEIDKMYYFHDNELIYEMNELTEKEYSIRESDAEELFSEVSEYLNIYDHARHAE